MKIERINDEIRSKISVGNKTKLWTDLFIADIEYPSVKTIEISHAKMLKINTRLTNHKEKKC